VSPLPGVRVGEPPPLPPVVGVVPVSPVGVVGVVGRMEHGDSLGNTGRLGPGDVQWMTAGRGIVHSEFPRIEEGLMWGFQLWVNLPAKDKMTAPRYQDIPAARIPEVAIEGGLVRVVAGTFGGVTGPVEGIATRPTMLDARLDEGASVVLPAPSGQNAFAYPFEGTPKLGADARSVARGNLAVLGPGDGLRVEGPGRVLLLSGTPLGEPIARYGPFVMNTRDELVRAFEDFRAGRLGR